MSVRKSLVVLTAVIIAANAVPAFADDDDDRRRGGGPDRNGYEAGYRDAYRHAYREGYNDARSSRRFDDTDYSYGNGHDYNSSYAGDPRFDRWRARYARTYTYTDDTFYQECRTSVDPGGVLAGALIGGLVGNAAGRDGRRAGATVAGVVVGGTLGAALTRNLDCEDRSYAYKTYYDGFNAGRPNARYEWRNPRSGRYGSFQVRDYYSDPDGFRCANYTQQIFINGRPQAASGRACQQPAPGLSSTESQFRRRLRSYYGVVRARKFT